MKKQIKKVMSITVASVLLLAALSGCGKAETSADGGETAKSGDAAEITVTFMNGEEQLGTASAKAGELLAETDYTQYENVEDAEFQGWFETPSFLESSRKDLKTTAFNEDTTLYGSFKSTNVTADTRAWYIAGTSSKGILQDSNWANDSVEEAARDQFRLQETGTVQNEFEITIDLYAGDQFQIIHDWTWDGQKGFGCFTTIDEAQMENGGGLGGTPDTSNVNVVMDGNYTITLTTDPNNEAMDTLVVTRNSDTVNEPVEAKEDEAYVVSDTTQLMIKGSWVADWSDVRELTREEGTNIFTITMELEADTEVCFMVYDNGENTDIVLKEGDVTEEASLVLMKSNGNNIQVAEAGNYTFTVDADNMSVTLTK